MTLLSGQGDGKGRTLAGDAAQADLAAHEVEVFFDDAQAKAGTGDAGGVGGAEEALEEVLLFFRGNADAPVPDVNVHGSRLIRQGAVDGGGFGGVFDGVGQEVTEDIAKELDID
jgi:hypothetical protein